MSIEAIRALVKREDPSLLGQLETILTHAHHYALIRGSDSDHAILREAPDGSFSILKGEDLDHALEEIES